MSDYYVGGHADGGGVAGFDELNIRTVGAGAGAVVGVEVGHSESCAVLVGIDGACVAAASAVAVETRRDVAGTGRLVDKGRKHNIAHTVPYKRCGEIVFYCAYIGSGAGSGIDLRHAASEGGIATEGTIACLSHEYDNFLIIRARGTPCVGDTVDRTGSETHGSEFGSGVDALAEAVAPSGIDRYARCLQGSRARGICGSSHKAAG